MAYVNPYERALEEQRREAEQGNLLKVYGLDGQGEPSAPATEEVGFVRRAADTVADVRDHVYSGMLGSVEGIVDSLVLGPIGAVGGLFSSRFAETMKKAIAYNVTDDFIMDKFKEGRRYNYLTQWIGDRSGEHSYLKDDGTVNNVARGIGGMLPAVAVSVATMGAATPAAVGGTAASAGGSALTAAQAANLAQGLSTAAMAAGAAGQAEQEAYQDGAGFYQGQAYGVLRGATEAATEYALGGTTKLITGGGKAMLPAVRKSVASTGIKRVVKSALEEGAEEMISEGLDPLTRTTYKGKDALAEYADPAFYRRVLQAGKDGTLTGLVFQGTVGHALGNTGKAADVREVQSELETLSQKRRNLHNNNRLTAEAESAIGEAERENWRVMETVLKKATPEKRAALMEDYGLAGRFSEDGSMTAEFSAELDRRAAVREGGLDRRTASVEADAEQVQKVLAKEGRTQFTDVDNLSKEEQKNLRDVKRVMDVLYDVSGGAVGNFVIANESVTDNAYYDGETGYIVIGADALKNGVNMTRKGVQSWFQTLLHEAAHGTEGTTPSHALAKFLVSLTVDTEAGKLNLGEMAIQEVIDRGYFGDDAEVARARIEELLSLEGDLRAIFENSGVDNKEEVRYNKKKRKSVYKQISKREYAVLSAEVTRKRAAYQSRGESVPRYGCGYTDGFFYVYENQADYNFGVLKQIEIKPETQEFIKKVEGWIEENGRADQNAKAVDRIIASIRSGKGLDRGRATDGEHGSADLGDGRVSGSKQESYAGRNHGGSPSDQRGEPGVKNSRKLNSPSAELSMEQMERDIADLEKLNSERTAIMVEQFLGNKHFARRLLDADAGMVEKLLNRIAEVKETLARRKDPEAKATFEEIRKAEQMFLDALAEKGMRFEGGKIVGASEDEDKEKNVRYSLREQFTSEFDAWMQEKNDKQRLVDGGQFEIGKTADALKSIGMRDAKIYWRKSKIQYIMEDHPAITPEIIKKVPSIVENPIIVMKSKTIDSSITMFGDIKAGDSYVMVAVELNPTPAGGLEAEFNLISSAYDRSNNNAKNLIQTSEVLYLCDKKRADTLLMSLGVQFPSDQQVYGSIGSITYKDGKVNISGKKIFADISSKSVRKSRKATAKPVERYSYEYFVEKDDMPVTVIDDTVKFEPNKETREGIVNQAQKNAVDYGATVNGNGNPVIHVEDADLDVILGKNGLRHGLDRRLNVNAPVTLKAGEILANAIKVNELNPRKETITASYVLIGVAKNSQNEPYIVEFVVNQSTNEVTSVDVLYSVNAKTKPANEKESAGSLSPEVTDIPATLTDSVISIAQLLDFVNRYFPDVMPEDVYRHYGHLERPKGELGKSVKYSKKANSQTTGKTIDPAKRKAMANLTHQKVYNKADATNIVDSFIVEDPNEQSKDKDVRRMERELKGKIIDFVWDRLNTAVSKPKQGVEAFAMAEKIVIYLHRDELMREVNAPIETVAEQLFDMDLSSHQYLEEKIKIAKLIEKAYGDYGKESRRAKQDQKVEQLKKKYTDPITWNDRTNTIVKLAMDLFNWKNEVFFNHTNISDVDLFRRTLGKLTGTRYHGYFNEEGARKCIEEYGKWYLSEATEKILGKGESWSVYSEEIAEKIRTVANGKGDLTTADLDDIIAILQEAKAVSEAYGTVFKNGKRVKAIDVAKEEAATVTANANIKMGFMDWLFRRYGAEFGEPGSFFRYIDRHRPGFLTEFFERFREDNIQAQKYEYEMISLLDEVLRNKKYRGYLQDAHKRTVEYRDGTGTTYQIPADIATALYMSLMTPANAGMLAPSGFAYKDPKTGKTIRPSGFMIGFDPYEIDPDTKRVRVKQEVIEAAEEQAAKLYEQFTEADMEYISAVEEAFEKCGELKSRTDIARRGWTNTMKGYYFPAKTAFTAKQLGDNRVEIQSVAQESFNKHRTEGNQHELWFDSLDTIARSHIHGVSVYAALGQSIDDFELLYHMDVSGNPNKPISIRTELSEIWPGGKDAMEKFIDAWKKDVQGISDKETSDWAKTFEKIRGNVAVAAITGNLKVLLSQVSSYFAAANVIDTGMLVKGLNLTIGRDVDDYSTLAMLRHKNNEAALAQGVLDKLDGAHDFLSQPIGWMDRRVVVRLFTACQYQIVKDQKLELGSKENKKAAGELLERVILETQQNALATEKSAAMRSKNPILRTFVMFSADSMKQIARLLDGLGEIASLKAEAKFFNRGVDRTKMNKARKKTARAAAVMAVQAVYMVAIAQLIQLLLNRIEDKEPEEIAKDLAVDFFGSILGGLPVIRDIYDGITQGYGTEDMSISAFNDIVSSVSNLIDMAQEIASGELTGRNAAWTIRKVLYAIGNVAGIPVRNIDKYADGLIRWVAPDAAYKKDNALSVQPFRSDIAKAIEQGDEGRLETVIGVMLDENVGEVTSSAVRQEMKRLVSNGMDVLPRGLGDTVTVDGEAVKLTVKQQAAFKAVYSEANKSVEKMVGLAYYSNASDEAKAKAIKRVYGIYYNRAIEDLLGVELENKNTLLSRAIDPEVLAIVLAVCGEITADRDKDGKAIANSKKRKVEDFVDSLKLRAAQKFIIMGALGYKNRLGEAKVQAYVNGLGLKKAEREALMGYAGY